MSKNEFNELKRDLDALNKHLENFKKEVKYAFDFKDVNLNNFSTEKLLKTIHNLCIVDDFTFKNKSEDTDLNSLYIRYCQIAQYHAEFSISFKFMFTMFMKDIENIIKEKTDIDCCVYISKDKFKIKVKTECIKNILSLLELETE